MIQTSRKEAVKSCLRGVCGECRGCGVKDAFNSSKLEFYITG